MKQKLYDIEIQYDINYTEPFNLVLRSTEVTLVPIPVTAKDLKTLHNIIAYFLRKLEESK